MTLTDTQIERYSRHIILSDFGGSGQETLLKSRVLVIGAGGLGSPVLLYLAAAGVGNLGIIDADTVDLSNLQRQIIHQTASLDTPKVESARDRIQALNPDVSVVTYAERFTASNALAILKNYDFIIDGTDNFEAKFLINDACVLAKKPFSHGGILRFDGQTLTHVPGSTCYRCIFPELPPKNAVPTCSQAGVLGAVAGIIGTIQATEAVKYLTGIGDLLINALLTMDAKQMRFRKVAIQKNAACRVCSENASITTVLDTGQPVCDL